jgi:hypothetical protein
MQALHSVCLPVPHGTSSTLTPQRWQLTRRMQYSSRTMKPQKGTNSKRRWGR